MRLTALASNVGLSHSIQAFNPASMVSASKGKFTAFTESLRCSLAFARYPPATPCVAV